MNWLLVNFYYYFPSFVFTYLNIKMAKPSFLELLFNRLWPWKPFEERRKKQLEEYESSLEKCFDQTKDNQENHIGKDITPNGDSTREEIIDKTGNITSDEIRANDAKNDEQIIETVWNENNTENLDIDKEIMDKNNPISDEVNSEDNKAVEIQKENLLENKLDQTTDKTIKEVEKVLYEDDLDKVKYFLRRFFLENIWKEPKLEVSNNVLKLEFDNIKLKKPLSEIILQILKNENFSIDKEKYWISLRNKDMLLSFPYFLTFTFEIDIFEKANEDFLRNLKLLLEKYFVPHLEDFNEYKLSESDIVKILELDWKDKITLNEDKLNILLNFEKIQNIDERSLILISNHLSNISDFYVKVNRSFLNWFNLDIADFENNFTYRLSLKKDENNLLLSVEPKKYGSKLTRAFVQNFLKNLIGFLKELVNQEENLVEKLKNLWVMIQEYKKPRNIDELFVERWFVGYEDVKEQILTHIVEPWKNKEDYQNFVNDKLPNLKNIVPNAALFYWVPGTWKTTMSSIIWEYLWYPFVYIPVNSIMSKWFWESENRLNDILGTCWKLAKKEWWVVIMIDEIDEIWWNRDKSSSDASNRILWVLLKKLDWLEKIDNILLIGWTNRNDSLDLALLSRFSQQIEFRLPNEKEIVSILRYYLPILEGEWIEKIANKLKWKSWRDIKKISEDFARYIINLQGI